MVFALENADAAGDVVEVLEEALTLPETAPGTKLARLYLVNDILANATAPVRNASRWGPGLIHMVGTVGLVDLVGTVGLGLG
jgi:hypothetical protein